MDTRPSAPPCPENGVDDAGRSHRVGPIDPVHHFPLWYEDSDGTRLELGLDPDDPNLPALELPTPGAPVVFRRPRQLPRRGVLLHRRGGDAGRRPGGVGPRTADPGAGGGVRRHRRGRRRAADGLRPDPPADRRRRTRTDLHGHRPLRRDRGRGRRPRPGVRDRGHRRDGRLHLALRLPDRPVPALGDQPAGRIPRRRGVASARCRRYRRPRTGFFRLEGPGVGNGPAGRDPDDPANPNKAPDGAVHRAGQGGHPLRRHAWTRAVSTRGGRRTQVDVFATSVPGRTSSSSGPGVPATALRADGDRYVARVDRAPPDPPPSPSRTGPTCRRSPSPRTSPTS